MEKERHRNWESRVLGIVFVMLGFAIYLAGALHEALGESASTARQRPHRPSPGSGEPGGLAPLSSFR